LEELELLNLSSINYESLEEELKQQESMDDIVSALDAISGSLNDENGSLPVLKSLKSKLERSKIENSKLDGLIERLNSTILELEDIAIESSNYLENLEKNPERIIELTTKLDAYNRVAQKHKCLSQDDLMQLERNWIEQLSISTEGKAQLDVLLAEISKEEEKLIKWSNNIHEKRKKASVSIEKEITDLLAELKMPNTSLQFELTLNSELTVKGNSNVTMLFSTNKGIPVQPIEKIASGGELSRLMLAIQCLISEKKLLPSIIFDEIDTGVSGEVAQKIGNLLQRMGKNLQLIAISHLPQVAGKARAHIKVEKFEKEGRTLSNLKSLNQNERVEEIARLMSGSAINEAALINAKSLMDEI
jgi:DNA repair protein RecN (Recombination protein N)